MLIAVPSLECGGLERNVSIICNNIDSSRFDVTLTVLNNANQFFPISNPAIKIIDLKINNVRKSLFAIAKLSRQIKPDIILTTANHLNLFFGIFKWLFPKRIRIIARESSIVSINVPKTWNARFYKWLLRTFYKKLDLVICQSVYMRDDLVKNCRVPVAKTFIINNAVQTPVTLFSSVDTTEENSVPQLITVARLSEEKGVARIIRALSQLSVPFKYTIIGEGPLRPQLEKLIKELSLETRISMPGRSDKPFAQVNSPTLFLMGSFFEGFPNVLLEANSLGIPVVAFNAPGGIGELITNDENGLLVEGNDETAFAIAVKKALDHSFDRDKISLGVKARFDVKKIITRWEALLENVYQKKDRF